MNKERWQEMKEDTGVFAEVFKTPPWNISNTCQMTWKDDRKSWDGLMINPCPCSLPIKSDVSISWSIVTPWEIVKS